MASQRFVNPVPGVQDPTEGAVELIAGNIARRRKELAEIRGGAAVRVAGRALAAMRCLAYGHIPAIRADRQERLRGYQLAGDRGLPLEDIAAISLEGDRGRDVAVAGLRVLCEAIGYSLRASEARVVDLAEVVGLAAVSSAALTQEFTAAVSPNGDGGTAVTLDEIRRLKAAARVAKAALEDAEGAVRRAELQFTGGRL